MGRPRRLFVGDLVGSTRLSQAMDPEEWRDILIQYQEACARVVARYEGFTAQYLGDGILVYFGYPKAHEDSVRRAVLAGLGIVEAVQNHAPRTHDGQSVPLNVRIGIHTGLVVVGEIGAGGYRESTAQGAVPNIAARVQGVAAPGNVVISAKTHQLAGPYFDFESLGCQDLKGVEEPLEVFKVLGELSARSQISQLAADRESPMIGREREFEQISNALHEASSGQGRVVLLEGEAGVGKSRILQQVRNEIALNDTAEVLHFYCSAFHQTTPFHPVVDLLERQLLHVDRDTPAGEKLKCIEQLVADRGYNAPEAVPLLAGLVDVPFEPDYHPLPLTPEGLKLKTMDLLAGLLLPNNGTTAVRVVEDLHWVDPSTRDFVSMMVQQAPERRMLLILDFRPEFESPWEPEEGTIEKTTLQRLDETAVRRIVNHFTFGKHLPDSVMDHIIAKADGVPLFVEELTKAILESDVLVEKEDHYQLKGRFDDTPAVPATLSDSLMSRLDRVASVKSVAQIASILGREFTYENIHDISEFDEETLKSSLRQLVDAEILFCAGEPPAAMYSFKHALIQDAA
ncbi:MAG: adenylate/guanylate cyclase domain-containing protein, partial [Verrucomicrobiota bacterium]